MRGPKPCVPIEPICEAVGLDSYTQARKLRASPLHNCYRWPKHPVGVNGNLRIIHILPIEEVGLWLCRIKPKRVREEIRPDLIAFQQHCHVELHKMFVASVEEETVATLQKQIQTLTWVLKDFTEEQRFCIRNFTLPAVRRVAIKNAKNLFIKPFTK